ncbi:spondin domain-containing protein [Thalassotalea piscium]
MYSPNRKSWLAIITFVFTLTACNDSDPKKTVVVEPEPTPVNYRFDISVTNLTNAQPMSPIAIVLHNEGNVWEIGAPASEALEHLAESGDNAMLLAETQFTSVVSGAGVLMPGNTETITLEQVDNEPMLLSLVTMLVNTNDAFTGLNGIDVSSMEVGEIYSFKTSSYDAGTENNNELMANIPGPAAGGEGFNTERDDVNFVAMHPGIVSKDDGLTNSALSFSHRFDNPTLNIVITRVE